MKNKKAILFDWDGTIAKTLEVWLDVFEIIFKDFGVNTSRKEISEHFGDYPWVRSKLESRTEEFWKESMKMAKPLLARVSLYDGVKETIHNLSKEYRLVIVTSSAQEMLDAALSHSGLADYFEVKVSALDTQAHKPDPEPVAFALKKLNLSAEEVIFVGDTEKDTRASGALNIPCIFFAPQSHNKFYDMPELLKEPNIVTTFKHWSEFEEALNSTSKKSTLQCDNTFTLL